MRAGVCVLAAAAALAGCDGADEERARPASPKGSADERLVRGWIATLNVGDYDGAASFFAPNALVDQGNPYHLRDRDEAREFNASLPCRADLTDVDDEGDTVLASFRLRTGPGGPCRGEVRVRFTIRKHKFTIFRQLQESAVPPGSAA
jgi:hypothetical protein